MQQRLPLNPKTLNRTCGNAADQAASRACSQTSSRAYIQAFGQAFGLKKSNTAPASRAATLLFVVLLALAVSPAALWGMGQGAADTADGGEKIDYRDPAVLKEHLEGQKSDFLLIDVRNPNELNSGFIPGAVNIPVGALNDNLPNVPKESPVVVYCGVGARSARAAAVLEEAGYTYVVDFGGMSRWEYPLQKE